MSEGIAPRKTQRKKLDVSQQWLARYHDPRAPGSLGGVQRFARAHQLPLKKAQRVLERDLAYTLHKPRRRHFLTLPVIVGGLDDQWVADLVEVQPLAKHNRGIRYLLTVLDVLSKYAWVQPLKAKTGFGFGFGQSLSQDPETRTSTQSFANGSRDGILQPYISTLAQGSEDQAFFHRGRCQSECGGTV